MIFDCFTFNGEFDILELRLNILDEYVDKFVIVESSTTFSGKPKPLYFLEEKTNRFHKWLDKIIYRVIDFEDPEIANLIKSRGYVSNEHFRRAFNQKESIKKALVNCKDEDIIYYGDVDEIWKPKEVDDKIYKLDQLVYTYYLNNRSSEPWKGTVVGRWGQIKNRCLNDLRAKPEYFIKDGGWHFTNMGGIDMLRNKIESYDHQEINIPEIVDGLEYRINSDEDFLGRNFKMWVDESDWPLYLKDNRQNYKYLLK